MIVDESATKALKRKQLLLCLQALDKTFDDSVMFLDCVAELFKGRLNDEFSEDYDRIFRAATACAREANLAAMTAPRS